MIQLLIKDNETQYNPLYYGSDNVSNFEDHGTTHISVLDSEGNAVSVTSTINI